MVHQSRLEELERDECLALLAAKTVGRVVFTDRALPAIQPVNYLLDGEEIVFRTGPGDKLAAATRNAVVAFEIDDVDEQHHSGWSVVGIGQAHEVTDVERLVRLAAPTNRPWVAGHSGHTIAIPLDQLTGRRLAAPTAITTLTA